MLARLRAMLAELEDVNFFIQNGCIDPNHLHCFKDEHLNNPNEAMATTEKLIQEAYSALDKLTDMMTKED